MLIEEDVDILVHDFFGQLLYDESLYDLDNINFIPKKVLPDRGELWCGTVRNEKITDPCFNKNLLMKLKDILISSLFDEKGRKLIKPILKWEFAKGIKMVSNDISELEGDILYFGIKLYSAKMFVCQSGRCSNWSYVWTYRYADKFSIDFKRSKGLMDVYFKWEKDI